MATTRPRPRGLLHEGLTDDTLQGRRELGSHLALLVGREDVDDAVDGLRGILRVKGGEHEVAGLRCGERDGDGLEVAELADEDHVGVLAQHVLERGCEAVRVVADLTLVDQRTVVVVQELDRVFDGDDVVGARAVDEVDERGERRRLSGAGRAGDQHEAAGECWRMRPTVSGTPSSCERLDLGGDDAEGRADRAALLVEVHAEARVRRDACRRSRARVRGRRSRAAGR